MKPLYLSIKAFGPYLEKQEIDFTEVSQNGIFVICGETGAGKTAILDAVVYALYGKSSGSTRGDITAMRCQLAASEEPTEIEFIFEIRGAKYKFTRTIKYGRKNFTVSQNAMYCENEVYIPFFENPRIADVESKATQLLGVNYEQFRQVIMLPQGQFERLLLAKSDEKEKILVSLFGIRGYARAAEIITERLLAQRRRLDIEKDIVTSQLKSLNADSAKQLADIYAQKKLQTAELTVQAEKLLLKHTKIEKKAAAAALLAERFKALIAAKKVEENLFNAEAEMQSINDRLILAEKAESIRGEYKAVSEAHSTLKQRLTAKQTEENIARQLLKEAEDAKALFAAIVKKSEENEQNKQRLAYLKEKTQSYEALGDAETKYKAAKEANKKAEAALGLAQREAEEAAKQSEAAAQEVGCIQAEYQSLLTGYIAGISGTLAQSLKEGAPCPVCGSSQHPCPAKKSGNVTEAQLDEVRSNAEIAAENYAISAKNAQAAAQALLNAQNEFNAKKIEAERCAVWHEGLLKACDKTIRSLAELKEAIKALESSISVYEVEFKECAAQAAAKAEGYNLSKVRIEMHEKELSAAENQFSAAREAFHKARNKNGFTDTKSFTLSLMEKPVREKAAAEYSDWRAALIQARKQAQLLHAELKGEQMPDIIAIDAQRLQAKNEMLASAQCAAVSAREERQLESALKDIQKRQLQYEKQDMENRESMAFAKQLRGDSGISLQRYVLGVMLNMVVFQANKLLERVHSGRYALYRTHEASGGARKAGLELEVLDKNSGERRSVATLSGGEKFLAALSLSIGLSAVVQAQSGGIALEAMFIDEGFGTLDPASINDALSVLAAVNKTAATVGIISHVDSMNESIPSKIFVEKAACGSRLSVICG